jgi:hypothetical protein
MPEILTQIVQGSLILIKNSEQMERNRLPNKIKQAANQEDFRKRLKNSKFEFQRNRDQNKYSIQGTPVNLLRYQTNR